MADKDIEAGLPSRVYPPVRSSYGLPVYAQADEFYNGSAGWGSGSVNESRMVQAYLQVLLRSKILLAALAIVGLLLGIAYSHYQLPVYHASASINIQGLNGDFLKLREFDPTTAFQEYSADGEILTQARFMQRDALLEQVANSVKERASKRPDFSQKAIDYAYAHVDVRMVPGTHVLELICDSTNNEVAADFVNTWAKAYINENREERTRTTQLTEESLRALLSDAKLRLAKADEDLLAYARANQLMFTGQDQSSVDEAKLRETQTALSAAETERIAKQSQYELLAAAPQDKAIPSAISDPSNAGQPAKLEELRGQLADLKTYMAAGHPKVVRLEAQIADLESSLNQRTLKRVGVEFEAAQRRENLLGQSYQAQAHRVSNLAQKSIQYNILKREADANRVLYESLLQKVKDAGVSRAMRAGNVRLVDGAKVPALPYKPRKVVNALIGLMAGLFLGIAFVTVRDRADRHIRTPGESPACLRVPELGAIPSTAPGHKHAPLLIASSRSNGNSAGIHSPEIASENQGLSILADSFRGLLASLLFAAQPGKGGISFVVTSAGSGEGKSTVISNLGLAMAETDRRVLLIDGDLRCPRLHEIFGVPEREGLNELLHVHDPSAELIASQMLSVTGHPGLYLLQAGKPVDKISNLLYSARLPNLLDRLRQEFDAVLIDSPPMLQAPDARILARVCGAAVLVIRAGHTSRDTAAAARQRFAEDGTRVLGTVLNDWSISANSSPYYRKQSLRIGQNSRNGNGQG